MKNISGSVEREAEVLKGTQFLLVPPWDFCLSNLVYEKNKRQMPASYFYTSIDRPFEIQTTIKISFFNAMDLKFCHFGIFDMPFPFLAFFKL